MLKKLEIEKFSNIDPSKLNSVELMRYRQRTKNTRFGNYKQSTHGAKYSSFLKKQKRLNRRKIYKLKKIFCSCFKLNTDELFFDELYFYNSKNIFKIKDIKAYILFIKKLIKILLMFLTSYDTNILYSEIDFLRHFLNKQAKIRSILTTKLVTKFQNNISKNIKILRNNCIIPTVTSAITVSKSILNEDEENIKNFN